MTDTLHDLFITDLAHMPGGIYGTRPAWRLHGDANTNLGANDPAGEIDTIENVNTADINISTLWASRKEPAQRMITETR